MKLPQEKLNEPNNHTTKNYHGAESLTHWFEIYCGCIIILLLFYFIFLFTVRDDLCSSSLNFFEVCSSLCLWDCYLYFWFMDYVCLPLVPVCIFISLLLSSSFPFCLVSQSCLHVYLLPVTVSRSYVLLLVSVFVTSCFILIAPHLEWIAFSFGSPCLVNQIPFSYVPWCFPDVYILFIM